MKRSAGHASLSARSTRNEPGQGLIAPGRNKFLPILVIAVGAAAYFNSFSGVFIFDDTKHILDAERIRRLWPPWEAMSGRRPLVDLSLAANYAVGELNEWGYHAFNLGVHILASLALFGLVRRTLLRLNGGRPGGVENPGWFAAVVAMIWAVHPLQTQSVTYIIQRGESLMGLFYLLTLYCVTRGAGSPLQRRWYVAAVVCCALGMGCKAVMVTAPLMVLMYDRAFFARSFVEALRKRRGLYAGLSATWLILAACGVVQGVLNPTHKVASVGFSFRGTTPLDYALTQAGVLVHYLRLALWPYPLCLDYDWPAAATASAVVLPAIVITALLIAVLWAFRQKQWLGFIGAWFFVILAPTSSFVPIKDALFEHRMYLSLAAVATLMTAGGYAVLTRLYGYLPAGHRSRHLVASGLVITTVAILAYATARRNGDYHSRVAMWNDVVTKRPNNARGHYNLGYALSKEGNMEVAMAAYRAALEIRPDYPEAHNNLGNALKDRGRIDEAMEHYQAALQSRPNYPEAYNNIGNALKDRGEFAEAIRYYRKALRLRPHFAEVYSNIGVALVAQGRFEEGMEAYRQALRIQPGYVDARVNLGVAWARQGRSKEAVEAFREALRARPGNPQAHNNLGNILAGQGKLQEAIKEYREALRLDPGYADAHTNLGNALLERGKPDEAIESYREALRLQPRYPEAYSNLCLALSRQGRIAQAIEACRQAIRLRPRYPEAHYNLANALLEQGKVDEAIAEYRKAISSRPQYAEAHSNLGIALGRQGKLTEAVEEFRAALRISPDYAEAHSNLGNALAGLDKLDEAINAYRTALQINPDFVEANYNLGRVLLDLGRPGEAARAFRDVLRVRPDHTAARRGLEDALEKRFPYPDG